MILIEFHKISTKSANTPELVSSVMTKLLRHHSIVHTHGSNCSPLWELRSGNKIPATLETSFVRNDLTKEIPCVGHSHSNLDKPVCPKSNDFKAGDYVITKQ